MVSLASARKLAADSIQKAQCWYKKYHDQKLREKQLRIGTWVLVHFSQDECGRWRKLSRPWHGPYRIIDKSDADVTCVKVYRPEDGSIYVHQSRACPCPGDFPAGYFWYGGKKKKGARMPS